MVIGVHPQIFCCLTSQAPLACVPESSVMNPLDRHIVVSQSQNELIRFTRHLVGYYFCSLSPTGVEGNRWTQQAQSDAWSMSKALVGLLQGRCDWKEPFLKKHLITWLCNCVSQAGRDPHFPLHPWTLNMLWNCAHSLIGWVCVEEDPCG